MASEQYDVVIVGSGFGGAIMAMRLAQAGQSVLILERGKHYKPGEFPRDLKKNHKILWDYDQVKKRQGLFDIRFLSSIATVSASGVGGGSLIYANIHYRPDGAVFDSPRWPKAFNLDTLAPYYDEVATQLNPTPIPDDIKLPKHEVFTAAAEKMGVEHFKVPQAIAWQEDKDNGLSACQLCAECEFGCQKKAKNTLDFNYLAQARRAGAQIQAGCLVSHVETDGDGGYRVAYQTTKDGKNHHVNGKRVVLSAGTLGTNEILLRSRDLERTLPNISARLGHHYSGNGDFLGSVQNTEADLEPWNGPDVTAAMKFNQSYPRFVMAMPTFNQPSMEVLASFGQPKMLVNLPFIGDMAWDALPKIMPLTMRWGLLSRPALIKGPDAGPANHMANLFAIGQDNGNGKIVLENNKLDIQWNYEQENKELVAKQEKAMAALAGELGGTYAPLASWSMFKKILTVHNLGGCALSDDPDSGVVDNFGEVHGYPGLYVADGSVIPTAVGCHPVMTISAIAEWIAKHLVDKLNSQA